MNRAGWSIGVAGLVGVACLLVRGGCAGQRSGERLGGRADVGDSGSKIELRDIPSEAGTAVVASAADGAGLAGRLDAMLAALAGGNLAPDEVTESLDELREILLAADQGGASVVLADFLASGRDADTGLPLVVGSGGNLDSWPSLRVWVLDALGSVDPSAALEVSRRVMDGMESPDEYAVALRNLSWNDLDGDLTDEFRERFGRLLDRQDWREAPSAGYLEALDAAVRLADRFAWERILRLNGAALHAGDPSLARACFMVMDRMVENSPAWLEDPGVWSGDSLAPDQRASLMSRLDIRDAVQRALLGRYLSTVIDPSELDTLVELFPNGNHLHGGRLFSTPARPPSIDARMAADRGMMAEIEAWQAAADPQTRAVLGRLRERLGGRLDGDADGGGQ